MKTATFESSRLYAVFFLSQFFLFAYQLPSSKAVVRNVVYAEQFQRALDKAMPGDSIKLKSNEIFFKGQQFTTSRSGEAGNPIIITGTADSGRGSASITLDPASFPDLEKGTTGLTIRGDYWIIEGIELLISKPHTGVRIEGNNNSASSLIVTAYETGVYINGSGNTLMGSIITSTNGTSLYLSGDNNNVTSNVLEGPEWGMYLVNGTCCGEIVSNVIKGPVLVQGSKHSLRGNVITGDLLVVSECDNYFSDEIVNAKNSASFSENNNCPPPFENDIDR